MKRHPALVLLALLAGVGAWWFFCFSPPRTRSAEDDSAGSTGVAPARQAAARAQASASQAVAPAGVPAPATPGLAPAPVDVAQPVVPLATNPTVAPPLPLELANLPPATVLENMRTVVRQYAAMFGGNPVGTNEEITRALQGGNPRQINFLRADGNRVNGQGELVDVWGTPYFFHQISGIEMEIRSAGPDRQMWTADDLVIK